MVQTQRGETVAFPRFPLVYRDRKTDDECLEWSKVQRSRQNIKEGQRSEGYS